MRRSWWSSAVSKRMEKIIFLPRRPLIWTLIRTGRMSCYFNAEKVLSVAEEFIQRIRCSGSSLNLSGQR